MRATQELDQPPHARRAASGGAARSAAMRLRPLRGALRLGRMRVRALLATLRLALMSVVGVLGAVLALAPMVPSRGPLGRRLPRLPAAHSGAPLPVALGDRFLERRAGEAAQP